MKASPKSWPQCNPESNQKSGILGIHEIGFPLLHTQASFLQKSRLNFIPQIPQFLPSVSSTTQIVSETPKSSPPMEPEDQSKQSSDKNPYTELEQVNSDFVLAISLQEQERTSTMLPAMDSETEEDEDDSFFDDDEGDTEFFESQEFEGELEFPEEEGSNEDEEMEEDEVDPDELSYEELLELGEFIGEEKRGLSINEIPSCLHPYNCHPAENKTEIDRCVICQVEYEEGEVLVALQCEHPYHAECISKWLQHKKVCPICNNEVSSPKKAKNLPAMNP